MRLLTALLLASCFVGCGGSEKEEKDDTKVNLNGNKEDSQGNGETNPSKTVDSNSSLPAGKAIPADFPNDIPIDKDMICVTITKVKDDYMITFHTKKTIAEICEWFKTKLGENSWKESGTPSISETKAILAYDKLGRKCGVSATGFVLDASMQKDESTRGITIQTKAMK